MPEACCKGHCQDYKGGGGWLGMLEGWCRKDASGQMACCVLAVLGLEDSGVAWPVVCGMRLIRSFRDSGELERKPGYITDTIGRLPQ